MARMYSRATQTVAAVLFSPSRALQLSVVGVGLAVFAGQRLPHLTSAEPPDRNQNAANLGTVPGTDRSAPTR